MLQLNQLLGADGNSNLLLTDSLANNTEQRYFTAVETLYNEAIQNRPDIQVKKMNVKLAESNFTVNKAERLPRLSFVAAYQLQAQADDRSFGDYRWPKTSFVGLQASIPLFSGGRVNAKIRQSNISRQRTEIELTDASENAKTEIITLESNLKALVRRQTTQANTVQAAKLNYRIVNDRYRHGLSSRLDLSDPDLALTDAKLNQLHTVYNVKVAKTSTRSGLGFTSILI